MVPEAFLSGIRHRQREGVLLLYTLLLCGDVEHLALSLRVKARQPDGDKFV